MQAYNTVGNVIAQNAGPLGDAIDQLENMSAQLSQLLNPNLQPLQSDIATITQVGRTLDRNLGSIDQGLASTDSLFAGAGRAYDPTYNWLNLNVPTAPGLTSNVVAGLVRDRLAGICRRVLDHHSAGLSASQLSTLQTCGNPDSGFFDPLLSVLPNILSGASGSGSSSSQNSQNAQGAQAAIAKGLTEIPGLTPSQQQQLSQIPPSDLSGGASASSNGASSSQLNPSSPQGPSSSNGSGGLLGGLLHGLSGAVHFFGSLF